MSSVHELLELAKENYDFESVDGIFQAETCLSGFIGEGGPRLFLVVAAEAAGIIDAFATFADTEHTSHEEALTRVGFNNSFGVQLLGPAFALRTYFDAEATTQESFIREIELLNSTAKNLIVR